MFSSYIVAQTILSGRKLCGHSGWHWSFRMDRICFFEPPLSLEHSESYKAFMASTFPSSLSNLYVGRDFGHSPVVEVGVADRTLLAQGMCCNSMRRQTYLYNSVWDAGSYLKASPPSSTLRNCLKAMQCLHACLYPSLPSSLPPHLPFSLPASSPPPASPCPPRL